MGVAYVCLRVRGPREGLRSVEGEIAGDAGTLLDLFRAEAPIELSKLSPRLGGKGVLTEVQVLNSKGTVALGVLRIQGAIYVDGALLESGEAEVWTSIFRLS